MTRDIAVKPLTMYSEFHLFRYWIQLVGLNATENQNPDDTGLYPMNTKAVIYPKIAADPKWGTTMGPPDYIVPFPYSGNMHYCPQQPAPNYALPGFFNKSNNSAILGRALIAAGFPKPPVTPGLSFQAHHILETVWGGDDTVANGVWLNAYPQHQAFTTWWNPKNFVLPPPGPQQR